MPQQRTGISINPKVLKWARVSAGWAIEEVAYKLKITPDVVSNWESGRSLPTLAELEKLAGCFKRTLATLLLPKPPSEPTPPVDFRVLPGERSEFAKKTLLSFRRARRLRGVAINLLKSMQNDLRPKIGSARLDDNPEEVAPKERKRLGIELAAQTKYMVPLRMLDIWRSAVESQNILVFSFSMPLENARGFSLHEKALPIIVINSSDAPHARIFTLFHEYAHLLLRESGVCIPDGVSSARGRIGGVESWCNRFAGALLLPGHVLETDKDFRAVAEASIPLSTALDGISRRYKVSALVALRRMLTAGLITNDQYQAEASPREAASAKGKQVAKAKIVMRPEQRCLKEKGKFFVSLVLDGQSRDFITHSDAVDYLSVRTTHFDKLRSLIQA